VTKNNINIQDVGPIEALDIPIPPEGGVVVLRGANGVGKTSALDAARRLLGNTQQLSCRDGQQKGMVEGLGVKVTVGRSTRRTGELEAIHLEGKLSIDELVDPGLKSDEAADAKRIRAMVSLSGIAADENLFREEVGEDIYTQAVSGEKNELDLLEMSSQIKADLHGYARRRESEAVSQKGQASGYRQAAGEVSDTPVDEAAIKAMMLETAKRESALQEYRKATLELRGKAEEARKALDESGAPTPQEVDAARSKSETATGAVKAARSALAKAERKESKQLAELARIERAASEVVGHRKTITDAEAADCPSEAVIKAAAEEAREASEEWDQAAAQRDAHAKLLRAEEHDALGKKATEQAVNARDAAKACDHVLEKAIRSDVLRVSDGRLYVSTSRGPTLFGELSDGERWEIAIDLAAERVGEGGLIVVPQSAWEGLDTTNRTIVASRAKERKVIVITAEAQRSGEMAELHAEIAAV